MPDKLSEKAFLHLPGDFPFDCFEACGYRGENPPLHFHDCLELNYIISGTGINHIENKNFHMQTGELYVINNLEHHMASSDSSLKMRVIVFDPQFIWTNNSFDYEYLEPFYNRGVSFSNRIDNTSIYWKDLYYIVEKIDTEWRERQKGFRLVIKANMMELLAILYRHFSAGNELGENVKSFQKSYDRIRNAINYIQDNYHRDMTLGELAGVALMGRSYFSTYFKKVMEVNVFEYIEYIRLNRACVLLKTTNKSITDISCECGFNNLPSFNKSFRKLFNKTPTEFRKKS